MNVPRGLPALLTLIVLSAIPSAARPCTPSFSIDRHQPRAGAQGFPLNGRLILAGPIGETHVELRVAGGSTVLAQSTEVPDQSPWALSKLVIYPLPGLRPTEGATITVSSLASTATITVGVAAGDDTELPRAPNAPRIEARHEPAASNGACVPSEHYALTVSFDAGTDNTAIAAYTLLEVTSATVTLGSITSTGGAALRMQSYVDASPGRRCFAIRAYDLAGNQASGASTCLTLSGQTPDGGVEDAATQDAAAIGADAGHAADAVVADTGRAEDAQGCQCSGTGRVDTTLSALLILLGFGLRARRGSRSSS